MDLSHLVATQTESRENPSCDSRSSCENSSSSQLGWPIRKAQMTDKCLKNDVSEGKSKSHLKGWGGGDDSELEKQGSKLLEIEMMTERFARLLLGEDMSGSGKGVCPALAISNAITNLCSTVFGQLWRLEPMAAEKKTMWKREMEWLLCVSDHIVEMIPSWQTFPDGKKLEAPHVSYIFRGAIFSFCCLFEWNCSTQSVNECHQKVLKGNKYMNLRYGYLLEMRCLSSFPLQVMTCQPRSDLFINLPALRKLDNMLLEILDCFTNTEFWYVDQGIIAPEVDDGSASFRKVIQRQEDKWWLPVPRVPPGGLPEESRKQLNYKRECGSQILKAAMAINSIALAEMEVPESFLETLPKNGRACLGDFIYRYITSEHFSSECLLDCLDLSSEHNALEIANRVEASIYAWRRRLHSKPPTHPNRSVAKSSWEIVKDLMIDGDKRELLTERAESLLLCLKQRFPGLAQTTLDATKIQFNKDVGKSILESYSRVLESLAFNIVARIDDLLYVDDLTRQSDKLSSVSRVSLIAHKKVSIPYSVPVSGTPYRTAITTMNFLPAPLISPARGERSLFLGNTIRPLGHGSGVKRVLTKYLLGDAKVKTCDNILEGLGSMSNRITEGTAASRLSMERKASSSSIQSESRLQQIVR